MQLTDLHFENTYANLGEDFFTRHQPLPFEDLAQAHVNQQALALLGISPHYAKRKEFTEYLTGLKNLPKGDALAMLYAGHQFGHWVPQLGDGRALVLGQIRNADNQLWELQLKGGGPTAYSRAGDGRAVLRSTIREYICSEAMQGLGIPTTRSLAMFHSDAPIYREEVETAAMMIRLAPSHVRFGSFEVFYHRGESEKVKQLCDYVIHHYYPECLDAENPVAAFFEQVVERTALMIAKWQAVGFAHGVMNTDNMSVLGLTIDYGPFGFLDAYQPGFICNHSDHHGRYAFNQQPNIAMWNLVCFGSALLSLIEEAQAKDIVEAFPKRFMHHYEKEMQQKLGFAEWRAGDDDVLQALLGLMQQSQADYTNTWRALSHIDFADAKTLKPFQDQFIDREQIQAFLKNYQTRLADENSQTPVRQKQMLAANPKYVFRNYMAEIAIRKAKQKDFTEIDRLINLLQTPFDEHPDCEEYAGLPPDWAGGIEVSCSS